MSLKTTLFFILCCRFIVKFNYLFHFPLLSACISFFLVKEHLSFFRFVKRYKVHYSFRCVVGSLHIIFAVNLFFFSAVAPHRQCVFVNFVFFCWLCVVVVIVFSFCRSLRHLTSFHLMRVNTIGINVRIILYILCSRSSPLFFIIIIKLYFSFIK